MKPASIAPSLKGAARPRSGAPAGAGDALNGASSLKGILAMVLSMCLFITNDTFIKLAVQDVPLGEALAVRSSISAVLLLTLIAYGGGLGMLHLALKPRVLTRSVLDTATNYTYVVALAVMPIASTTTIYLAAPLITIALAVPLLGEKVSATQWSAILVGFAGAIIVMRPDPATFHLVAVLPLAAAACGSVRDIATRSIGKEIPGSMVSVSAALTLSLVGSLMALFDPWHMPASHTWGYLVGAGCAFAGGTLTMVFAFRNAPVRAVSPLRYILVIGAVISGFIVFGDLPDAWAWVGIALVVGAGLYSIHLEHQRSRKARREAKALAHGALAQPAGACAARAD